MNLFTSSSKKYSKIFLIFFLVTIFLFIFVTELIFRLYITDSHSFEQYKTKYYNENAKIVIFGDSHVVNGINDSDKLLNMGYAGDNINSILTKALHYSLNHDVEFIGLQADPHLFSYYRIVTNQKEHLDSLLNHTERALHILRPHLRKYLLSYWKTWLLSPSQIFSQENKVKRINSDTEMRSVVDLPKETRQHQASIRAQLHRPIEEFQKSDTSKYLLDSVQKLLDMNVKVCLISYPLSSDYRLEIKKYQKFSQAYDFFKYIADLKGIKYMNYNDRYKDKDFSDSDHLNMNGSNKLTSDIINDCLDNII